MAIRLYSEFKSDNGTQYKIEIHDASWVAAATTFNVDSRGFDLIYEGETDDIVSPIVSSRLTFGAYSENATFETFINTLKTFQENRFQLAVRKYNGASYDLIWAGWITQDLVSVEDESQPYIYEITATDGIGRLSNIDYTTANTISQANGFKATDIIAILKTAFVNIGTSDLWGAGDAFFETSVDWWETNYQTYATSTDPISQHAVDVRLFNEFDDDGNVVYSSTLDILRQIATLYNGRFYMQNGRFVFEQYGNRDTASRYVSRYTKAGTHLGRVLVSDDKTIDQTANAARRSGNGWDFLPATQTARVHYVQKFLNPFNAFGLFRFRNSTNAYTAGFIAGGSGIQLSIGSTSFNFKVTGSASLTSPIFPVFKMRIRIQDSSTGTYYYYNRSYNGVAAGGAMFGTPAWSTTSGFYYFDLPPFFTSGVAVVNQPVSIITDDMPVNGELDLQLTLHGVFRSKNGTTYTPSTTPLFDSIFVFGIQTNGSANAPGATFSSNNTTTGIDSKLTLDLGDLFIADGPRQTGHLAVFTGADWVGTSDWRKGSSGASLPILKLLTNETLALHVNPIEQYNGNVITSTLFGQRLVFNSAAYLMTGGTFNASSDEWSGTWYKIESVRANVTALTPVSDLVQKATIATATTSGSSSNDIIGGRIGGMVVDIEDQKIGPFQQTASGARLVGDTEITGTLDVDGAAQFNNDVNITGSVTSTGPLTGEYVQLDTTYNTTPIQGQIVWSQDDGTIDVGLNSNVTMQVGQEQFWFVKNQTGSTIPKGTAVRAAGTLGASGRILGAPMVADGSVPARFFLGIAAEDILDGGDGYVTTFGKIRQLNTSAFTEGSVLWCNPAVAGGLTSTEPSAPNLKLAVAFVVRSNATSGVLAVRSEIGARVSDASDVQVTSVADNDLLQYNTATSRWENVAGTTTNIAEGTNLYYTDARSRAALSAGVGISYNNGTGVITNSAPDQVVAITASTAIAVTGTYPNFTIENTAPDQVVAVTAGTGISVTGTYPNFTITNTSPSSGGTITGGGTTNYLSKWTGASALGDSLVFDNGTNVGIGTATPGQRVDVVGVSSADTYLRVLGGAGATKGGIIIGNNDSGKNYGSLFFDNANNNVYLYQQYSAGDLILGTNTNEKMRITSAGNVGIGTTAPVYKFEVSDGTRTGVFNPNAALDGFFIGTYQAKPLILGTADTERMRITADGNVAIGTTNSGYGKLGVYDASNALIGIANSTSYAQLQQNGADLYVNVNLSGTAGAGSLVFRRGASSTESMRIDPSGNVGIGTTAPGAKLEIAGTNSTLALSFGNSVPNNPLFINTYGGFSGIGMDQTTAGLRLVGDFGGNNLVDVGYYSGNVVAHANWVSRMRVLGNGNVGIGTTAPYQSKLHVTKSESGATPTAVLRVGNQGAGYTSRIILTDETTNDANISYLGATQSLGFGLGTSLSQMVLTSTGNVGIGTTAPALTATNRTVLSVNGTSSSLIELKVGDVWKGYFYRDVNRMEIYDVNAIDFSTNGSIRATINSSGNVGIGTTNPTQLLQVAGNEVTASKINAVGTIYGSGAFLNAFSSAGGNDVGFAGFIASQANQTNRMWTGVHSPSGANQAFIGTPDSMPLAFWTNSAERMRITSGGNVGIGTTNPTNGNLEIVSPSGTTMILSDAGSIMRFVTAGGANYIQSANAYSGGSTADLYFTGMYGYPNTMVIKASGNVGIGTTGPGAKLEVAGTIRATGTSGQIDADQTSGAFRFFDGSTFRGGFGTDAWATGSSANDLVTYVTNGSYFVYSDAAASKVFTITSGGNVGIGTTAPAYKLDVNGNARVTSTMFFGANAQSYVGYDNADGYYRANGFHYFEGNGFYKGAWDDNGKLGIGTTSPTEKLHVDGNAVLTYNNSYQGINSIGNKAILARVSPTTGIINYAEYATATNLNGFVMGSTATQLKGIFATNKLEFTTNSSTRMTITSGGLVGIGTTSPSHILHITDVIRMDNVSAYSPNLSSTSSPKYGYGDVSNDRYLAEPVIWFKINVDGTEYVIPGYTEVI